MAAYVSPLCTAHTYSADGSIRAYSSQTFNVDEGGTPGIYKVIVMDRVNGRVYGCGFTDADGVITFKNLPRNTSFLVVALDSGEDPQNAAVSDYVSAVDSVVG